MHDYALYIGRFQPFHRGHLASVKFALSIAKKLIIILGGYQLAPSTTDPWTASMRKKMILSALTITERQRIQFIFIRDRLYNEDLWKENVSTEVHLATKSHSKIVIVGHAKDYTSYYLKIFPQWQFIETGNFSGINGTQFREQYFSNAKPSYHDIPSSAATILKTFRKTNLYKTLQKEHEFKQKTALTQQNTSVHNNFILLLVGSYLLLSKRSNFPGKNLYSLPHLNSFAAGDETEGSNSKVPNTKYFVAKQNFFLEKYDGLNKQGKAIIFYHIPNSALDMTKYLNSKNTWVLFDDFCLMEDKMFADHYQIIRSLLE